MGLDLVSSNSTFEVTEIFLQNTSRKSYYKETKALIVNFSRTVLTILWTRKSLIWQVYKHLLF
jgi:hypothetical protein